MTVRSAGSFTQPARLSSWLKWEINHEFTRRSKTLLAGSGGVRAVVSGQVLGAVLLGSVTVTPGAVVSGTAGTPGNGAIGTVTADAGAMEGDWSQVFIEPTTNLGTFEVIRPDGTVDGTGVVGTAYNGGINFTQADGSNDFVAGDIRTINVAYAHPSPKYAGLDLTATNGLQTPAAICLFDAEAADGVDGEVLVLEDMSLVDPDNLVWPAGITDNQKAAALVTLADLKIKAIVGAG